MLTVIKPGLQATLQGAPRIGYRHFGLPYSGPADELSMALANRLVGNAPDATCLEITYGGFEAEATLACSIAITGAHDQIHVSGTPIAAHATLNLMAGDVVSISPPLNGVRTYLAVHSGFEAPSVFNSTSTYIPAGLGGISGRALRSGDTLHAVGTPRTVDTLETPHHFRPVYSRAFALRACASAETSLLTKGDRALLFTESFSAGRQATRMGIALTGHELNPRSDGMMKSAPVFPGTIQCPPSGVPVVLLCDAQTTGGYPRIASIARCDRHQLGQIRPGDQIQLLERAPAAAVRDNTEKRALIGEWLNA